ncbi:MAG: hypothetical protein FJ128_06830 [Deltaproteobacteria bacterium]|nr:hypothetical protein [Deltaproteobacteria bacterium]
MQGILLLRFGVILVLLLGLGAALPAAAGAAPDVGLVTQVAGEAVFVNPEEGGKGGKVQAFMKIRRGDRLTLSAGASVTLVYFANSRKEFWQGPVEVTVEEGQGAGRGKDGAPVHPQVSTLPT